VLVATRFVRVQQRRRDTGLGGATEHVDMPGLNVRTSGREPRDMEDLLDYPSRDWSIAEFTAANRRVMISSIGACAGTRSSLGPITASSGPHIRLRLALISIYSARGNEGQFGQAEPSMIEQKFWRT
jgi:hypothetical protein